MNIGTGRNSAETDPAERDPAPERPGRAWTVGISALIAVYVLLGGYALFTGVKGPGGTVAASTPTTARTGAGAAASSAGSPSTAAPLTASSAASPPPPASSPSWHPLSVASVTAFGPDGPSDGDNPGIASRADAGSSTQPWYSLWYASSEFGNLQDGTGLLLNMGKTVTVSNVQVVLGGQAGANVQVRVGDTAVLADLSTVATATNVAGIVQFPIATGASGQYVLIWFTALPPIGQGRYQVSVYGATVDGPAGA